MGISGNNYLHVKTQVSYPEKNKTTINNHTAQNKLDYTFKFGSRTIPKLPVTRDFKRSAEEFLFAE